MFRSQRGTRSLTEAQQAGRCELSRLLQTVSGPKKSLDQSRVTQGCISSVYIRNLLAAESREATIVSDVDPYNLPHTCAAVSALGNVSGRCGAILSMSISRFPSCSMVKVMFALLPPMHRRAGGSGGTSNSRLDRGWQQLSWESSHRTGTPACDLYSTGI